MIRDIADWFSLHIAGVHTSLRRDLNRRAPLLRQEAGHVSLMKSWRVSVEASQLINLDFYSFVVNDFWAKLKHRGCDKWLKQITLQQRWDCFLWHGCHSQGELSTFFRRSLSNKLFAFGSSQLVYFYLVIIHCPKMMVLPFAIGWELTPDTYGKTNSILSHPSRSGQHLFDLSPMGRHFRSTEAWTTALTSSFFPLTIDINIITDIYLILFFVIRSKGRFVA